MSSQRLALVLLLAAAGTFCFWLSFSWQAHLQQRPAVGTNPVPTQDISRARIETIDGIRILHLYGSPAQMGEQHGRLLKDEIQLLVEHYLHKFFDKQSRSIGMHSAKHFFQPYIPQTYLDEMRALALSADISFETVLLAQCFLDINRILGCSTVALAPDSNAMGESLLLRNLDFPSLGLAEKHSIVIVRHPHRGRSTVTVGWPLLLGTLSGFNDDGLALAMMEVYQQPSTVKAMPYNLLYRHCLEHCNNTAAARRYFARARISAANNLTCIDRDGDSCVLELSHKGIVRRNGTGTPVFATNHFNSKALGLGKSCDRYAALQRFFTTYQGDLALTGAEQLLQQLALKNINLQAFVMLPGSQRLHISLGRIPAADGPYITLDAADLELSQRTGP